MTPRKRLLFLLIGWFVLAEGRPQPALADELSLDLDPAQSTVKFTLGAFLHAVSGTFVLKQGTIRFDPATGRADGSIVVDLASGQSGEAKRDARMRSDVLQVQTYPYAVFTPSLVQGRLSDGRPSELDVTGDLAIHGDRHPMTLQVSVDTKGDRLTAHSQFSIPYVQWGMKDPSTFLLRVANHVEIDVSGAGDVHLSKLDASGTR